MNRSDIQQLTQEVLQKILNNQQLVVSDELTADQVEGWDSLTHMVIITELEKKFNIRFRFDEIAGFERVGDMIDRIQNKLS